jgi:uroporphyrinogen III methyltransferase/synthase
MSSSVTFLTAHADAQGVLPNPNTLMQQGTLVLYMGAKSLAQVQQALIQSGRSPETPTAVIEWGTYARQRCVSGTLQNITDRCAKENIQAPALIVVGDVCALRNEIHWFEARPLHGLRVVVTHAVERQGKLESRLRELGAEIFALPMLQLNPTSEAALTWHPSDFDWIILSSVNAAKMLFDVLDHRGEDARAMHGVKLCAVGASTIQALETRYVRVDAAPEKYGTESVLKALDEQGSLQNARVLLPRSDIVRRSLPEALRKAGAQVTETVAYTHQQPDVSHDDVDALKAFDPGLMIFTNAAAIDNFAQTFQGDLLNTPIASIGPVTSAAAKAAGLKVAVEPATHTVDELLEAVCTWWAKRCETNPGGIK